MRYNRFYTVLLVFSILFIEDILFLNNKTEVIMDGINGIFQMETRRTKSLSEIKPISAENLMVEITYIMDQLELKDVPRVVQIFRTSLDPVALVKGLGSLTGKSENDVLRILETIDFFKPIAANYRVRTAASFDPGEFQGKAVDISVSSSGYAVSGMQAEITGQPISDYLKVMRDAAGEIPFVFRDNMEDFVGRFLGMDIQPQVTPDLREIIDQIKVFLTGIDLGKVKYVVTSGIGANEMYSHELAYVVNKFFEAEGLDCRWKVVNNPADLGIIPEDAVNSNTVVFEMSRSGTTKETVDFFNATRDEFKRRIIAANPSKKQSSLYIQADQLKSDPEAVILVIDNTRGDIGGRQMNRKTLMVYAPLFMALSCGLQDMQKAEEYTKYYCQELLNANNELDYGQGLNSAAVKLAEFLFRHRESGRSKFSVIFDESLRATHKELFQLLNEGANKNIAGGTNNNFLDAYSLTADKDAYRTVFEQTPDSQLPIFLLNKNSNDYADALVYIEQLKAKGVPCIVLSVDITSDLENNLKTLARTSALLQDMVVYFTYITNQDANSNPAVKLVREITGAMFEIIADRKKASGDSDVDIRLNFAEVTKKIADKQVADRQKLVEYLDKKNIQKGTGDSQAFEEFRNALGQLSAALGIPEGLVTGAYVAAVSKGVVKSDVGEAGGSATQLVEESFSRSELESRLGVLTPTPSIPSLKEQVVLYDDGERRISVAVEEGKAQGLIRSSDSEEAAESLAGYLYSMYKARKDTLMYMPLTYMAIDAGNPTITELRKIIMDVFVEKGITTPLIALPGEAHKGIEAIMSHPECVLNVAAILYTDAYGEGLGTFKIDENTTIDEATYVYGISNVIRMALAGSPSIIFEVTNSEDLDFVKGILRKGLELFVARVSSEDGYALPE